MKHQVFRRKVVRALKSTGGQLDTLLENIRASMRKYRPFEYLMLASIKHGTSDPSTYTESSHRGKESVGELLLYLLATSVTSLDEPIPPQADVKRIIEDAEKLQHMLSARLLSRNIKEDLAPLSRIAWELNHHSLLVRGDSYPTHDLELCAELFEPFDDILSANFGFTSAQAIGTLRRVEKTFNEKLDDIHEPIAHAVAACRSLLDSGATVDELRELGRELTPQLTSSKAQPDPRSFLLIDHTSPEVSEAVLRHFSFRAGQLERQMIEDEEVPLRSRILEKPILHDGTNFWVPWVPAAMRSARPILWESLRRIASADENLQIRFRDSYSSFVEEKAFAYLSLLLPGSRRGLNLEYRIGNDWFETDGLLELDGFLFIVEAKATAMSHEAHHGNLRKVEDFIKYLIKKANTQSERVRNYLQANTLADFFDKGSRNVPKIAIECSKIHTIIPVVPSLWSLDPLPARASVLRSVGAIAPESPVPWIIFLNDLRIVAELFSGSQSEFLTYIKRRLRTPDEYYIANDETDYIGEFLTGTLYENAPRFVAGIRQISVGASDILDQWYIGSEGDVSKRPVRVLPPLIVRLAHALEQCGDSDTIRAAVHLRELDGNAMSTFEEHVTRMQASIRAGDIERDISLVSTKPYPTGVSIYVNSIGNLSTQALEHATNRCAASETHEWFAIATNTEMTNVSVKRFTKEECARTASPSVVAQMRVRQQAVASRPNGHFQRALASSLKDYRTETGRKPGRNDKCICGSEKKYKKCCGN